MVPTAAEILLQTVKLQRGAVRKDVLNLTAIKDELPEIGVCKLVRIQTRNIPRNYALNTVCKPKISEHGKCVIPKGHIRKFTVDRIPTLKKSNTFFKKCNNQNYNTRDEIKTKILKYDDLLIEIQCMRGRACYRQLLVEVEAYLQHFKNISITSLVHTLQLITRDDNSVNSSSLEEGLNTAPLQCQVFFLKTLHN
jgi:hypothetical protein